MSEDRQHRWLVALSGREPWTKERIMPLAKEDIINRIINDFSYHPPKEGQVNRYSAFRDMARELAIAVVEGSPVSREQSLALTHLEECVMWFNAAIARNE